MTVPIKYRITSTAPKPTVDSVKGSPLTSTEIDGNFRSLKDSIESIDDSLRQTQQEVSVVNETISQIQQDIADISTGGTPTSLYKKPGEYWSVVSMPETEFNDVIWVDVGFQRGRFIAIDDNSVYSSHDGMTWTLRYTLSKQWVSICFSSYLGAIYVFGAPDDSGDQIIKSWDYGDTWNIVQNPEYPIGWTLSGFTLGNWSSSAWSPELECFIVGSGEQNDTEGVFMRGQYVSDPVYDVVWTVESSPNLRYPKEIIWVAELSMFVAVGIITDSGVERISTSPDGITWTARATGQYNFRSVAWSPSLSLLVAVGWLDSFGYITTSPDGINWTIRVTDAPCSFTKVRWAPEAATFVAVGQGEDSFTGTGSFYSKNGINWFPVALPFYPDLVTLAWSPILRRFFSSSRQLSAAMSP